MKRLGSGELEGQVLDVLWSSPGALTPREVHGALTVDRPLAYTTVMTILVRLWKKGRVERERAGRAFAYRVTVSRDEQAATRMRAVLASAGDPSAAFAHFVGSLSPQQLAGLRKAVRGAGDAGSER